MPQDETGGIRIMVGVHVGRRRDAILYIMGMISFFSAYFSFFYHNRYIMGVGGGRLRLMFLAVCAISYVGCLIVLITDVDSCSESSRKICGQVFGAGAFIVFLFAMLMGNNWRALYSDVYSRLFYMGIIVPTALFLTIKAAEEIKRKQDIIPMFLEEKIGQGAIMFLIVIVLLGATYPKRIYFLWDGRLLLNCVENTNVLSLFCMSQLSLAQHVSYSYVWSAVILKYITGGSAMIGLQLTAVFVYISGCMGFWKLVRMIFPKKPAWVCILASLVFAVSPYTLGGVVYSYIDYALVCLFPLLLYEIYTGKLLGTLFVSMYFVFCKETAVVTYAGLLLGIYVVEAFRKKKVLHDIARYFMISWPLLVWLFSYFYVGHWGGMGSFGATLPYMLDKTQSYFLVNFNWVMAVVALAGMICIVACRNQKMIEFCFPIVLSFTAYLLMSISFSTIVHARYIDSILPQLYMLAIFPIMSIGWKVIYEFVLSAGMGAVLFVSSFRTIDPVMKKVYPAIDVGNAEVCTLNSMMSDGWCYNRQYQSYGKVMDYALKDVCENPNIAIFFMGMYGSSWYFDGMADYLTYTEEEQIVSYQEFWNSAKNTRATEMKDPNNIIFEMNCIGENFENFETVLGDNRTGCYLYTDYFGSEYAEQLRGQSTIEIINEDDVIADGWVMHRVFFALSKVMD